MADISSKKVYTRKEKGLVGGWKKVGIRGTYG